MYMILICLDNRIFIHLYKDDKKATSLYSVEHSSIIAAALQRFRSVLSVLQCCCNIVGMFCATWDHM